MDVSACSSSWESGNFTEELGSWIFMGFIFHLLVYILTYFLHVYVRTINNPCTSLSHFLLNQPMYFPPLNTIRSNLVGTWWQQGTLKQIFQEDECHFIRQLPQMKLLWGIKQGIDSLLRHEGASLVAQLVKNCLQCGRPGFDPWVGKIPWRRERIPTPVFWPEEFHGLYSSKESDMTEQFSLHFRHVGQAPSTGERISKWLSNGDGGRACVGELVKILIFWSQADVFIPNLISLLSNQFLHFYMRDLGRLWIQFTL